MIVYSDRMCPSSRDSVLQLAVRSKVKHIILAVISFCALLASAGPLIQAIKSVN
jgi:hypothetical protein